MRGSLFLGFLLFAACSSSSSDPAAPSSDAGSETPLDAAPSVVRIELDRSAPAGKVSRGLLGQYDLSGAMFAYDKVPGLVDAMMKAGLSEWRVGVGRWELATWMLPTLTDGTSCSAELALLPKEAAAPSGASDLDLLAARDWFSDKGATATLADTASDERYALAYTRSVLDVVSAFGATPWLDVDLMPRALSTNRTPRRTTAAIPDACAATFTNAVSNAAPADPQVFAAAVRGMIQRLLEGSGGEKGRALRYVELWNEPEFPYFWDKSFESSGLDKWVAMVATTLVQLDAYRTSSGRDLKLGMGSFASAETAAKIVQAFDENKLPSGAFLPMDFVSFHAYDNDPLVVADAIDKVAKARSASKHYPGLELALAEWGPSLDGKGWDPASMDAPLHIATVLSLGAAAGLAHAHHAIFWDYFAGMPFGLLDHDVKPKPLYHAYTLLSEVLTGARLPAKAAENGRLEGGSVIELATVDDAGTIRVLLVNRGSAARTVEIAVSGATATAKSGLIFDAPTAAPRTFTPGSPVSLPARSLALLRFGP